jgi:peptidoglycan/LPS O-acetylase OafA/YrhL
VTLLPGITDNSSVVSPREGIITAAAHNAPKITDRVGPERASTAGTRVASFDFVKGALVLIMVLYHWLNYFIGLGWGGYRYLRFLTPSFIFITGFLISYVYLSKYSYDAPQLRRRLWLRGLKLLALFLFLNVVANRTLGMRLRLDFGDPGALRDAAYAVFVEGTTRAAFDILVSIAYLLLLAPLVLFVSGRLKIPLWVLAAAAVIAMLLGEYHGFTNPHCEMLSIALVGLATGTLGGDRVAALGRSPIVIAGAYLIYVAAISVWNVPFWLQVPGVCLSVLVLYAIAEAVGSTGLLQKYFVRLGQYSLLAYIAQILILQILRRGLREYVLSGADVATPLAIGIVATVVTVETTIWLRQRSALFDRSYRIVFA